MCTLSSLSHCCALLSVFGIIFLFILGLLFDNQPFFTNPELYAENESEAAAENSYIAAGIYAGSLVLSLIGIMYSKRGAARRSSAESDHELAPLSATPPARNYGGSR